MVFPFGVSVSDFIAGVKLCKDAIESLSDTRGASADFAELSRSLSSLQTALEALSKVELDTDQRKEALKRNLDACRQCLERFLEDIAEFRKHDTQNEREAKLQTRYQKVKWALCKKDDVSKFRAEIETHVGALQMLLISFHVQVSMRNDGRTSRIETTTNGIVTRLENCALEVKVQSNVLLELQEKLKAGLTIVEQRTMFDLLQETFRQNESLRQEMKDLQTKHTTLMDHVLEIKEAFRAQKSLPSQVLLQQPVVLHDALGRIAPFHLEFIDSVAAFLAVLKIRFEQVGRPKITRLEFDLRDSARQTPIGLRRSWNGVFRPGQHVEMGMLFALPFGHTGCPGCGYKDDKPFAKGESVQCEKCFVIYRYGLGQGGLHFSEIGGIGDLIPSEDGDCNVSDFCRVSIVEPKITPEVESNRQASKDCVSCGIRTRPPAPPDAWRCPNCAASLSGLTPDFCPICGYQA